MLQFRKIDRDDLGPIYEDSNLRSILNISAKGDGFGVLIEKDGNIKGGLTGYVEGDKGVIQNIKVLEDEDHDILMEGLIRATVHILDREGLNILHTEKMDTVHERIGFKRQDDSKEYGDFGTLDIDDFFNNVCGSCSKKGIE